MQPVSAAILAEPSAGSHPVSTQSSGVGRSQASSQHPGLPFHYGAGLETCSPQGCTCLTPCFLATGSKEPEL